MAVSKFRNGRCSMQLRHMTPLVGILCLSGALAQDQQAPAGTPAVVRAETKLVLVDSVAAHKNGNYVPDLALKHIQVRGDNKEDTVKRLSFDADPNSPS